MEDVKNYFKNVWETTEEDSQVIEAVKKAKNILDVGCGHNQYKKYAKNAFWGIDIACEEADEIVDILNFRSASKYDLIICYGSLHFYTIQWVEDRLRKVISLLDTGGKIMMKVNPNCPNADGTILHRYDSWTPELARHYAQIFNLEMSDIRNWDRKRFKFVYVKK